MRQLFVFLFLISSAFASAQDTLEVEKDNVNTSNSPSIQKKVIETKSVSLKENRDIFSVAVHSANANRTKSIHNRTRRSPSQQELNQLAEDVEVFRKIDQNAFEYNYFKYVAGSYDVALFPYLKRAYELDPNSIQVHEQMVGYYLIQEDDAKSEQFIQFLFDNKAISPSLLDYGKDILASVPKNGTLITHGIGDTYAVVFLQLNMGIRNDVEIISLDLLQSKVYREGLKRKGYLLPPSDFIDLKYYANFCSLNEDKNIYTSLTVPKEYFQPLSNHLFITGLVMRYSSSIFDNVNRNINLWKYELSYDVLDNLKDERAKLLSSNYLPMLFQLRRAYGLMHEELEVSKIDKLLDEIGKISGKEEKVQSLKAKY